MKEHYKTKALYITNLGLLENLAKTQVLPYLAGLSKKRIKINVLSFEKRKYLKNIIKLKDMQERLRDLGIEWNYLIYHSRWGNVLDVFLGLIKTAKLIKVRDIDVLHARASIPILIAWPLAKLFRRKLIYDRRGTMVGDFVDDINVKNIFSFRLFSILLDWLDKFIIRHSDGTIVLSERASKMLKEDGYTSGKNNIIAHIPCSVNLEAFKDINGERGLKVNLDGKFVVNYLGSLGTCYLLKEMADFFKVFKRNISNALFLIISHTEKDYIEGVLKKEELEIDSDYAIVGLDPEEVPVYLAKTNLSIMFIKPALCNIGSSPTKFAESLAAGVPVCVNRNVGDIDEFIEKERIGIIVDGFDGPSYQKSIERLKDLFLDKTLTDRCRHVANEYFSLKDAIDKYYGVYENVLKRSQR